MKESNSEMGIMSSVKSLLPILVTFFVTYILIYLLAPAHYLRPYVLAFEAYDFLTSIIGFSRAIFLLTPGHEISTFITWIIIGILLGYLSKRYKPLVINSFILILLFFVLSQLNILIYSFSVPLLVRSIQQWIIPIIASLFITVIAGLVGVSLSGESDIESSKKSAPSKYTKTSAKESSPQTPKVETVISTKVCPHCGSVISSTVTYCPYCGKKV